MIHNILICLLILSSTSIMNATTTQSSTDNPEHWSQRVPKESRDAVNIWINHHFEKKKISPDELNKLECSCAFKIGFLELLKSMNFDPEQQDDKSCSFCTMLLQAYHNKCDTTPQQNS